MGGLKNKKPPEERPTEKNANQEKEGSKILFYEDIDSYKKLRQSIDILYPLILNKEIIYILLRDFVKKIIPQW